ncbi:unnamed protein product [Brachionus calyciflorus]|uniref:Uncharacterized protein n=1 Tax=Brachionus calyciflorus TaxID=104777 RepID=A0A814LFX8_9BILA|nr:unnamed protein product [Brachionus calyciflorus]
MSLPASVFGCPIANCLDTGTSRNFIGKVFLDQLSEFRVKKEKLIVRVNFKLGDGSVKETCLRVTLPITISENVYPVHFLVMEGIPYDFIFGMEFMNDFKVMLESATNTVHIDPDFDFAESDSTHYSNCLILSQDFYLLTFSSTVILVKPNRKIESEVLYCNDDFEILTLDSVEEGVSAKSKDN